MSNPPESKAARKASAAAAAKDKGAFELTEFGRRRVRKVPRSLVALGWLVATPFVFLYRHFRRRPA